MKKETEYWLVLILVSIVSIAGLFFLVSSSPTGAYTGACGPVYSEKSGEYYITCFDDKYIKNPGFTWPKDLDTFDHSSIQKRQMFPGWTFTHKYEDKTNPPRMSGTPLSIDHTDSNIGAFSSEKWLERHEG